MLPLSMAGMGETHEIAKSPAGTGGGRHLAELGLVVGERVTVMNTLSGNLILPGQGQPHSPGQGPVHENHGQRLGGSHVKTPQGRKGRRHRHCRTHQRRGRAQAPHHGHGVTKGTEIYVRKVAPLGDPLEVTIRGYELSIRKADAEMIELA